MLDTGQKLATAIDELTTLSTEQPATLAEQGPMPVGARFAPW
jgi:hypothetical protein